MGRPAILGWLAAAAALAAAPGSASSVAAELRIERRPEFVERVNSAIDRGVHWLRGAQQAGGPYRDYGPYPDAMTALAYYTLRTCGVPRDDPTAAKAFEAMRQAYAAAKQRNELKTYTVGLLCMALAEHGDPVPSPERERDPQSKLDADDTIWMKELVKLLEDWQTDQGRWSYPMLVGGAGAREMYDNSNTQYALLGLKAASRAGVRARSSTWTKSLRHFIDAQEDGGPSVPRFEPNEKGRTSAHAMDRARGWGYVANMPAYGSMTAGGVGSVVICRSELLGTRDYPVGLDAKAEQSARDGLAWLGANFRVDTNPGTSTPKGGIALGMAGPQWHYYYLYALERAGMLAYVEWMGEHDWYGEGAEFLLKAQLGSGAWVQDGLRGGIPMRRADPADDVQSVQTTCFALLFLKKGTLPVARGALTKSFDDSDINFALAPALSDGDFEDFIDLVLSRWRRAAGDAGKERLFAGAVTVGSRIVPPLIDRLSSTKDAEREAAFALLKRATGLDHSYDPAAVADAREDAVAKWQSWWLANAKTLRFDAATGRLVGAK